MHQEKFMILIQKNHWNRYSEVSVKKASDEAKRLNLIIDYKVDNCEDLKFKNNSFDLVYGTESFII